MRGEKAYPYEISKYIIVRNGSIKTKRQDEGWIYKINLLTSQKKKLFNQIILVIL